MCQHFNRMWLQSCLYTFSGTPAERKSRVLTGDALQTIEKTGDTYKQTYVHANVTFECTVGVENEHSLPDGTKIKVTLSQDIHKKIWNQLDEMERKSVLTEYLSDVYSNALGHREYCISTISHTNL